MVQVVSMLDVPTVDGSASHQSKDVRGEQYSAFVFCCPAPAVMSRRVNSCPEASQVANKTSEGRFRRTITGIGWGKGRREGENEIENKIVGDNVGVSAPVRANYFNNSTSLSINGGFSACWTPGLLTPSP